MELLVTIKHFFAQFVSYFGLLFLYFEKDLNLYHGVDLLGTVLLLSGIYTLTRNRFLGAIILLFSSLTWIKFNLSAGAYISIVGNLSILMINLYTIYQEIKENHLDRITDKAEVISKVTEAIQVSQHALLAPSELTEVRIPLSIPSQLYDIVEVSSSEKDCNPKVMCNTLEAERITDALFTIAELTVSGNDLSTSAEFI